MLLIASIQSSAQLTANFNADIIAGCSPLVVKFHDQSAGNATNWRWNLGNGTISQQQHPTGTYFTPGIYNVKLVVANANGKDSVIKNQYITVYSNPIVDFSVSDTIGCFPKAVQFFDKSLAGSGNITQWTWDFGDGNISSQQNPIHTYTKAGFNTVTLKVVNSLGCQKIITKQNIIQLQNTVADFSFSSNTGCEPTTINFNNLSTNAISYQWNFGDGSSSILQNPSHTYASAGNYHVKLVTKNTTGCSDSVSKTILVGASKADFIYTSACAGSLINFQNTSTSSVVSVEWNFGDGTTSTEVNPVKIFGVAGNYSVRLVSNFGECKDTVIKTVIVYAKPIASFSESGNNTTCKAPALVNFSASSSSGLIYQWNFGDGSTSTSKNPSHTYLTNGIFDVSLIVTNAGGCSDTLTKTALVKIKPPIIESLKGVPYLGCTPYTANLSAVINSPDAVMSWLWYFGDGSTSTLPAPSHVYSTPGTYDLKLIISTASGCKDSIIYPAAIRISNKPTANFVAAPLNVCSNEQVQFTNQSTGANEWLWIFGDGSFSTAENPSHQFGDTGYFTIKLIASSTGCSDTTERINYIYVDPPVARYNIIRDCSTPYKVQFKDNSIQGVTYKWDFGDGNSSILQNPTHVYSAAGTYIFTLIVANGSCADTTIGSINIIDEHPVVVSIDTTICKNTFVSFSATNVNQTNIATYNWDFGDGNLVTTNSSLANHQYTIAGTYFARLITTDILGCNDTSQVVQVKVYGPTASFNNIEGTCINSNVSFIDSSRTDGRHPIVNWEWYPGDGNIYTNPTSIFSHTYATAGVFNIKLKVTDSYGCSDSLVKLSALVIAVPKADFVLSDSIKCSANSVSFINQSNGLDLTYQWSFGNGATSVDHAPSYIYAAEGMYDIRLKVIDRFGCGDSIIKRQIISDPTARFITSDTFSSCPPLLVNVTNASTSYRSLSWSFGDGSFAETNNPSHYYTSPGTYQLKLTATGFGDCIDTAFKTIIIKGPTGSFTFSPSTICTNENVTFSASSINSSNFLWDFSDGITTKTTTALVSHVYDVPGYYIPKLILTDTAGCEVPIVSSDTLKVMGVKAQIEYQNQLFCDSAAIQFTNASIIANDLPSKYQWNFGDGSSSTQCDPLHVYNQVGLFSIQLKVTTNGGCIDSTSVESPVLINRSPEVNFNINKSICLHDSVQFSATVIDSDSPVTWKWNFSNGHQSADQNPKTAFDTEGNFPVKLVATNNSGCTDTLITSILVHPLPNVKAGTDTMICRGQTYTLQSTGAATYKWQNHPTLNNVSGSPAIATPLFNTTYYLKGFSEFGCANTDSVRVNVVQPSVVEVSKNDTLCEGSSVQLKVMGAAKYSWYPQTGLNNATISNPVANPAVTTNYMVIGSDHLNCFTDTGYVNLSVFPIPKFNIIDNLITVPSGSTATIRTSSSPDITSWKWYPAKDLSCADCPQPIVTAKDDIIYRAEVKNEGGCTATDKVTITVICNDGNVFIPNTFSPNNDGMNDVFYPRGKGITSIKAMKIFNRWGDLVYEVHDFAANDVNAGWNGSFKGSKLTPDVYVYVVDVVCDNSAIFTLKGNVTLIR